MTLSCQALDALCPMHIRISNDGTIWHVGPTMAKLWPEADLEGKLLFSVLDITRPSGMGEISALLSRQPSHLRACLRNPLRTALTGHCIEDGSGGAVLNFSFGIAVAAAVRDHRLSSADFSAADLTVEMLFLIESKSAAMETVQTLNRRLNCARLKAEEQATTDALTGLKNRRIAVEMLQRLPRSGGSYAVMLVDLDRFKGINDTHGHAAGDMVLRHVAAALAEATREGDVLVRLGGDEFLVILPDPGRDEQIKRMADRLMKEIEEPLSLGGENVSVSASIGIAVSHADDANGDAGLLDRADRALYRAKSGGRRQIAFADALQSG